MKRFRSIGLPGAFATTPDSGFTLIEVLVAFTILGLAAAVGSQILSQGAARLEHDRAEQSAVVLAESVLSRVGADIAVKPSHYGGEAPNQIWDLNISAGLADPPPAAGLAAYPVRVAISWQEGLKRREFALESVCLGPSPDAQ